jgi:hypothetical protein
MPKGYGTAAATWAFSMRQRSGSHTLKSTVPDTLAPAVAPAYLSAELDSQKSSAFAVHGVLVSWPSGTLAPSKVTVPGSGLKAVG